MGQTLFKILRQLRFEAAGFGLLAIILGVAGFATYRFWVWSYVGADQGQESVVVADGLAINDYTFTLSDQGVLSDNGHELSARVHRQTDRDELRYIILNNPGQAVLNLTATIELPAYLSTSQAKPQTVARHGSSHSYQIMDGSHIRFSFEGVEADGTATIVISFARGSVNLAIGDQALDYLSAQPALLWMDVSLGLILAGIVITLILSRRRLSDWRLFRNQMAPRSTPPAAWPPAIVGVLVRQKLTNRDVVATIIDLADRGYIQFAEQPGGLMVAAKRQDPTGLYPYEINILKLILRGDLLESSLDTDALAADSNKLVIEVYGLIERMGVFISNPRLTHLRWRTVGALLVIGGIVGLLITLRVFPDPPYIALFWLAVGLLGVIVFELGSGFTAYTPQGKALASDWLAFGRYLADPAPATPDELTYRLFPKYLAYALALGVEMPWLERFKIAPFHPPSWFIPQEAVTTPEHFLNVLLKPTKQIGTTITSTIFPTVD